MSAAPNAARPSLNRRRRVRQKVHAPAYATFPGGAQSEMIALNEVLDISEIGASVQCAAPMEVDSQVELCLDLAEVSGQISTTARVVWSHSSGRVGLGFLPLKSSALDHMRQWLFLNAMAAAANAHASPRANDSAAPPPKPKIKESSAHRPNYTDTLTAVAAVQREAESFGDDLEAVLSLIAVRSRSLLRASGAAIALAAKVPGAMICRASAGASSPPIGVTFQVGSGFSGECVLTGKTLRCDDAETDSRVDAQTCRALGIRSRLAAPVRSGERVVGLIEVFSAQPCAFSEDDGVVLQRFAETVLAAVRRAEADDVSISPPPAAKPFVAAPGSVLFAHEPEEKSEPKSLTSDRDQVGGIRLPRAHLYLLTATAAVIALVLGFILAPWIQEKLQARDRSGEHTVLASSRPPADLSKALTVPSVDSANVDQLRELADRGNASAENALGLLYAQGDDKQGVHPDESEAARWFAKAAEDGSVPAQYKLGLLYWGGHGVAKDTNKAYFWAVLARAGGQEGSKDLAKVLANGMTRPQSSAIEQQAEIWYQQHESHSKPTAAR